MNAAAEFFGKHPRILNTEHQVYDVKNEKLLDVEIDTVALFDEDTDEANSEGIIKWFTDNGLMEQSYQAYAEFHRNEGEFGRFEVCTQEEVRFLIVLLD